MALGIIEHLMCSDVSSKISWFSPSQQSIESKKENLIKRVRKAAGRRQVSEDQLARIISKLEVVGDLLGLKDCNIIHEATHECIDVKKRIYAQISAVIENENLILASNTSSISITELSLSYSYPENFIGIHFFNPVSHMKLVEVIGGHQTKQSVLDFANEYVKSLDKAAVSVNDAPGFIVNRMLIPMINEGISILADGVATKEAIDDAMKLGANHPIGPLALADLIGLDVVTSILNAIYEKTGNSKYKPHAMLSDMVNAGLHGRKSGEGFYKY
ncbi:3-hydroxybutyryl-CoA dehydrogenase [Chromobacterium violaceum]|nr:3-hydroxybutyryl-CoA dehydrogenase [Chromobacterium violaceum]